VIEAFQPGFHTGGDPVQDLKKARWHLDREIERLA